MSSDADQSSQHQPGRDQLSGCYQRIGCLVATGKPSTQAISDMLRDTNPAILCEQYGKSIYGQHRTGMPLDSQLGNMVQRIILFSIVTSVQVAQQKTPNAGTQALPTTSPDWTQAHTLE